MERISFTLLYFKYTQARPFRVKSEGHNTLITNNKNDLRLRRERITRCDGRLSW